MHLVLLARCCTPGRLLSSAAAAAGPGGRERCAGCACHTPGRGRAPAQLRDKQPVATPRHCPARGHLSSVMPWAGCWAPAGEEHPHLLALSPADECSRDHSPKWSLLGTTFVGWHCPFCLLPTRHWLRAGANRVCHTRATQGVRRRVGCECQVWESSGFPQSLSQDTGPLSHRLQKANKPPWSKILEEPTFHETWCPSSPVESWGIEGCNKDLPLSFWLWMLL